MIWPKQDRRGDRRRETTSENETIPYAMSLLRHGVKGRRLATGDLEFLELKSAIQILSL
jgi:hypothetical protein